MLQRGIFENKYYDDKKNRMKNKTMTDLSAMKKIYNVWLKCNDGQHVYLSFSLDLCRCDWDEFRVLHSRWFYKETLLVFQLFHIFL